MKNLFVLLLFLFSSFTLFGQVVFTPKAGINYTYMSNESEEDIDFENRAGFHAGFDIRFGQKIYFAPGVHYVQSKIRATEILGIDIEEAEYDIDFKAIQVPLIVGFDLFESERLGVRVFGGPGANFFIDEDDNLIDNTLNDLTWNANLGVGIDVGILALEIKQQWGLSETFDSDFAEAKQHILFLSAGIIF